MKHLAILLLIVLLVCFPSCKWLRDKGFLGKKADTLVAWALKQDSIRVVDSIRTAQDRLLAMENTRLDSIAQTDQEKTPFDKRLKYNIIVGSFITPRYATEFSDYIATQGYKPRIIKLEGTEFEMVSAEAYDNLATAVERLNHFQENVVYDSWIYVAK